MTWVTVKRRVRPLRLAFLLDPRDPAAVLRAIEINTVLWGGRSNALVPVYEKPPRMWPPRPARRRTFHLSPAAVVTGYLKAFDPDYVVEISAGAAKHLSIPQDILLTEQQVVSGDLRTPIYHSLDVNALYWELYRTKFQFVQRDPQRLANVTITDDRMKLLAAAWFGRFPSSESLSHIAHNFREMFLAEALEVNESNAYTTTRGVVTPLHLTVERLNLSRRQELIAFFLDPLRPLDVIDFWNLRAFGSPVVPIPQQWASRVHREINAIVKRVYRTDAHNPKWHHGTLLQKSFYARPKKFKSFSSYLHTPGPMGLSVRDSFPRMWDSAMAQHDSVSRLDQYESEDETEVRLHNRELRFADAGPKFAGNTFSPFPRWANEIRLRTYGDWSVATVLPPLRDVRHLLEDFHFLPVTQSEDAIVTRVVRSGDSRRWKLPSSVEVFERWGQEQGLRITISSAGKVAYQVLRSLNGPLGAGVLTDRALLELLDKLAHSTFSEESSEPNRRVRVGTVNRHHLMSILRRRFNRNVADALGKGTQQAKRLVEHQAEQTLERLLRYNVLRVGLVVVCEFCGQRNWYPLPGLDEHIICERCLQKTPFPSSHPSEARWEYRPVGPFATENFAHGAYTTALTLRFFEIADFRDGIVLPGCNFESETIRAEADFALFARDRWRGPVSMAVGECKTEERRFVSKDFQQASSLMRALPSAGFVFSTTRSALDEKEKRRVRKIAIHGRQHVKGVGWRNPVIVLTEHELMSNSAPPYCWEKMAAYSEELKTSYHGVFDEPFLKRLARATQYLHLDLDLNTRVN